ncbi:anti-sigma factor domain-containing protein [Moorella sulfitireducens (nom. illeg.)]|uniref:anti-sigma factor domain-containing protein n=1 Tax=Neomoorella sulfitireducens TaxID=2972948 RepID=UPI0021AC0440|nr:anti-sigma factor domain-containing protein [Moorella sulfitireducens]
MLNPERGLVVSRQGKEVIVLTPEGEWRAFYLDGQVPEVGEEVMVPPVKKKSRLAVAMAAAAAILLLFLALPLARRAAAPPVPGEPAYYINIDINPSIELAVDEREKVISARGLNEDGEKLLAAIAIKDEKADVAIEILTREAVRQGYYLPDTRGALLVTVSPAAGSDLEKLAASTELSQKLTGQARNILQQARVQAVVEAATVTPEIRKHAEAAGLSAGKYGILLEALEAGLPVTAADLQKESVARVLERYDTNWERLLQKLHQEKDLLKKEQQLGAILRKALEPKEPGSAHPGTPKNSGGERTEKQESIAGSDEGGAKEETAISRESGKSVSGEKTGTGGRTKETPSDYVKPDNRNLKKAVPGNKDAPGDKKAR